MDDNWAVFADDPQLGPARAATPTEPDPGTARRPPFRIAIVVGFGLTLGVWLFAGLYFGRRVAELEQRATTVSRQYLRAQQLLTDARSQMLLSTMYVRDALLDPSTTTPAAVRPRIEAALNLARQDLAEYQPIHVTDPDAQRVDRLRREIGDLQQTMTDLLTSGSDNWRTRAGRILRDRLTPKRIEAINVVNELGMLNRAAFVDHQAEINAIYRATQQRIWIVLGLALAVSLGIGLLAAVYAGRLERRVREQRTRDVNMRADLQRLSGKLIRVQEHERRALARELHDEIGQMLTAVKVELAVAQRAVDEHGGPSDVLDDARPIVDRALHAVRDLSHLLHPAVLDDLGLRAATERYVRGFQTRHRLAVDFVATEIDRRLASDVEIAAYRIVQEALTNVARHARATSCHVDLTRRHARLRVSVRDNGIGFNVAGTGRFSTGSGLGLVSMRERAAQVGGVMYVTSRTGRGTEVVADLPARDAPGTPPEDAAPSLAPAEPFAVQPEPQELA
jgi:signal transduction histidine kinase